MKYLLIAVLSLVSVWGCSGRTPPPIAAEGVMDLSGWNFEKSELIRLNGQWKFYWSRLLTPADFNRPDPPAMTGYFTTPGSWDGYEVSGKPLGPNGYATFRLKVKLPPRPQAADTGFPELFRGLSDLAG